MMVQKRWLFPSSCGRKLLLPSIQLSPCLPAVCLILVLLSVPWVQGSSGSQCALLITERTSPDILCQREPAIRHPRGLGQGATEQSSPSLALWMSIAGGQRSLLQDSAARGSTPEKLLPPPGSTALGIWAWEQARQVLATLLTDR